MHFKKGTSFTLDGEDVAIIDELGEGGQGEVYLVEYQNQKYAFKYYKSIPTDAFKDNLQKNIQNGSPYPTFLWPKFFIEFTDKRCGYFMDLRPSNYVSFISYLSGKNNFKNTETMLRWCIELVTSFKILHERGYSYQDLNDGSLFLNPDTGDLLICDNDNVAANRTSLGVIGKVRYMAPEIARGDKDKATGKVRLPDVHSDRFSLSVILFLTLCKGNPFEGERLKNYPLVDNKCEFDLFAKNPIYIFNKNDMSNRPIRGYHTAVLNLFPLLPSYIKEAFHKTFTQGLTDRENGRVTELEWLKLLCQYRDELVTCPYCGRSYAYGYKEKHHHEECPFCHKKTPKVCNLTIGHHKIALTPGKSIYKYHLNKFSSAYNERVGHIIQNKNNPSLWGIRLKLENDVSVRDIKGNEKTINKDGVIPIINQLKVHFSNDIDGEILNE